MTALDRRQIERGFNENDCVGLLEEVDLHHEPVAVRIAGPHPDGEIYRVVAVEADDDALGTARPALVLVIEPVRPFLTKDEVFESLGPIRGDSVPMVEIDGKRYGIVGTRTETHGDAATTGMVLEAEEAE